MFQKSDQPPWVGSFGDSHTSGAFWATTAVNIKAAAARAATFDKNTILS